MVGTVEVVMAMKVEKRWDEQSISFRTRRLQGWALSYLVGASNAI